VGLEWLSGFVILAIALFLFNAINILQEYERGAVFTLGRFWKVKGPGLVIIVPGIQRMVRVDLRIRVMSVPRQHVISRDNVSAGVSAVIYFRVMDPEKAVIQVENFIAATSELAQTTLRSVLGKYELDDMLGERDKINAAIQKILDNMTEAWGIKVANVEIKNVDLDATMIRAIAAQAEAERDRRAKIIHSEGELQASRRLVDAARVLAVHPTSVQLRYLESLRQISSQGHTHAIVFPFPIDAVRPLLGRVVNALRAGRGGGVQKPVDQKTP
jgi:regulator of protease activity HflC (stomatin/prohibitin superfamily)